MNEPLYHRHRFPSEIISHCVWLYCRFALSYRDINEMMAKRGVVVSHESIRECALKFGAEFAKRIRHQSARPGDQWYLDEIYLSVGGKLHYLWRAVDQDGEVLDILVQSRRTRMPPSVSSASYSRAFATFRVC
jgi:putative transposase